MSLAILWAKMNWPLAWSALSRRDLLVASAVVGALGVSLLCGRGNEEVASAADVPVPDASALPTKVGSGTEDVSIRPFHINIPEEALADLRRRIAETKWPDRETVSDATQGVQLATIQKLAKYWATDYDWRKVEARLNALPQFVTTIDGLDIHFIHVRSKQANALPVIVHAWVARIDYRATEDHRPAHRSDRLRWKGGRLI